ncbi:MAG: 3-isopropylmalate dehydrogenase [Pedobacter sp.]|nr:MAG: 3-isopropylmalate dehydrogenase [Pedobacter sp.]
MKKHILVIPGDGIGQEVTQWGKAALAQIAKNYGHEFTFDEALMGHAAIEVTGNPLPDETLEKARKSDAILFGAIGHAMYDNDPSLKVRPEQGLLKIRKELGLYANLRPILLFDELLEASSIKSHILKGTDILFFRELTGDVYFGEKNRSELWRETVQEIAKQYPDVETEHMFIDNAAMQLIKNPKKFDVVLTANLFGDILTDEASQIAGSMGMLASASVGDGVGFYEPIHGSAHDIAGKNLANPLASILSAALMLEISFGLLEEAKTLVNAVDKALKDGYRTGDIADNNTDTAKVLGTQEMGQLVLTYLAQ